jgi:hypothetical protein
VTPLPASNQLERKAFAPSPVWNGSVAVVITTYNYAQFLAEAIRSALTQKHLLMNLLLSTMGRPMISSVVANTLECD